MSNTIYNNNLELHLFKFIEEYGFIVVPTNEDKSPQSATKFTTVQEGLAYYKKHPFTGMGIMMGPQQNGLWYITLDFDNLRNSHYQYFFSLMKEKYNKLDLLSTAIQLTPNGIHLLYKIYIDSYNKNKTALTTSKDTAIYSTYFKNNYKTSHYNCDIISEGWYICVPPTPGYTWISPPENAKQLIESDIRALEDVFNLDYETNAETYEDFMHNSDPDLLAEMMGY